MPTRLSHDHVYAMLHTGKATVASLGAVIMLLAVIIGTLSAIIIKYKKGKWHICIFKLFIPLLQVETAGWPIGSSTTIVYHICIALL